MYKIVITDISQQIIPLAHLMTGRLADAVGLPLVLGHIVVDHGHDVGPGGEGGQH